MLASSVLAAVCQAVDASTERFEQVEAYQLLHPHLVWQSLHHVGDDNIIKDDRESLHCQLQAGGQPSSPTLSTQGSLCHLDALLAHFNITPMEDRHIEQFLLWFSPHVVPQCLCLPLR